MGAASENATIGSIADSIMDDASDILPDFVKDIPIKPATKDTSTVFLRVSKATSGAVSRAIFTLKINISNFEVTFVQVSGGTQAAKQLLRVTVDGFPKIGGIPLINDLPQPFEQLQYQWVRDPTGSGGLTQTELIAVNGGLDPKDAIMYKAQKSERKEKAGALVKASTTGAQEPAVITVGHHFIVIDGGKAIVDHNFNNPKSGPSATTKKPSGTGDTTNNGESSTPRQPPSSTAVKKFDPPEDNARDPAPSKGSIEKKTPLLSISSVALQFKNVSKDSLLLQTMINLLDRACSGYLWMHRLHWVRLRWTY